MILHVCEANVFGHGENGHYRSDQRHRGGVAADAFLAFAEQHQLGLPELSKPSFDKRCQTSGLRSAHQRQRLQQPLGTKLDDLLELGQPCFDAWAQLVKAPNLS